MLLPVLIKSKNKKSKKSEGETMTVLIFRNVSKLLNSLTNRDLHGRFVDKTGWVLYVVPLIIIEKVLGVFAKNYNGTDNTFPPGAALHYKPQHNQTNFTKAGIVRTQWFHISKYNVNVIMYQYVIVFYYRYCSNIVQQRHTPHAAQSRISNCSR